MDHVHCHQLNRNDHDVQMEMLLTMIQIEKPIEKIEKLVITIDNINLLIHNPHGIAPHQKDPQSTCQEGHLRCPLPAWTVLGVRRDQDRSLSYCLT